MVNIKTRRQLPSSLSLHWMTHKQTLTLKICSSNNNVSNLTAFIIQYNIIIYFKQKTLKSQLEIVNICNYVIIISEFFQPESTNIMTFITKEACICFYDNFFLYEKIYFKGRKITVLLMYDFFRFFWYVNGTTSHTCNSRSIQLDRHLFFHSQTHLGPSHIQ